MSQSTCSHQAYTYTYRTTCQCQLWESIDQPFVFDWQVWPQTVPPHQLFRASVQNLVWVSTLILTFHRKVHSVHPNVSVTRRCRVYENSSLAVCPYMYMLLCAPSNDHFAGSSHSHSVTQKWCLCLFNPPIHSVICLSPGITTCGNRTVHEPPHEITSVIVETQTVNTGMFKFKGGDHRLTWSVCAYVSNIILTIQDVTYSSSKHIRIYQLTDLDTCFAINS